MPIRIRSGNKTVIESGSFITYGPEEIALELSYGSETLTIRLIFENDAEGKPSQTSRLENATTLVLVIRNLAGVLPAYPNDPISLGSIADHPLWFRWAISSLAEAKAKLIQYTFYVEPVPAPSSESK